MSKRINLRNYFKGLITFRQLKNWANDPRCYDEELIAYVNNVMEACHEI